MEFEITLIDKLNNEAFDTYIGVSTSLKQAKKEVKAYLKKTLYSCPVDFKIKTLTTD